MCRKMCYSSHKCRIINLFLKIYEILGVNLRVSKSLLKFSWFARERYESERLMNYLLKNTQRNHFQMSSLVSNTMADKARIDMFRRIIESRVIIKSQQRNEPDLTFEEKCEILSSLLDQSTEKFLEKYFNYLNKDDIALFPFADQNSDQTRFYLEKITHTKSDKNNAKVKNRRYEALQRLIKAGEYFSDESMKSRDPLLYDEMIDKYEENQAIVTHSNDYTDGKCLTNFFMRHLDSLNHQDRLAKLKNAQQNEMNEEPDGDTVGLTDGDIQPTDKSNDMEYDTDQEEDEDNDTDSIGRTINEKYISDKTKQLDPEERLTMRNEFLMIMHRKFLNGEDSNFDYDAVDFNDDYDDIEIESRDLEENYFDQDDDLNDHSTTNADSS
jgi:hypothetical protein